MNLEQKPEVTSTLPENILHSEPIVCVCNHGNSRSKFMARVLDDMGYSSVRVLGIKDPHLNRSEKVEMIRAAKYFVCSSASELGDLKQLIEQEALPDKTLFNAQLDERLHALISPSVFANGDIPVEAKGIIQEHLEKLGFFKD